MPYDFRKVRVLIVDDQKYGRDLVKAIMKSLGVGAIDTAADGDSGYLAFRENPADIVITDWLMEPTCGLALTRRIRIEAKSPNPRVPIIMASGFAERWRVLKARDAGVTEYLVKPFTGKQLLERLTAVIEHPRPFIRAGEFFGPDRRRKSSFDYAGPKKRHLDFAPVRGEAPGPRSYDSSASAFLTGGVAP
jgi:DNA-binding response OmpR family regulator